MSNTSPSSTTLQLSGSAYDKLKKVVQVVVPGFGTLYFTLAQIWGLPAGEQVVGTCTALALFLGLVLQFSSKGYNANMNTVGGTISLRPREDGEGKTAAFTLENDPAEWADKSEVRFKIEDQS